MSTPYQMRGAEQYFRRTYGEMSPGQNLRELVMNCIEAGARNVLVAPLKAGVQLDPPRYWLTITDNGCGMTSSELVDWFSHFGASGKDTTGRLGNFGIGAMASTIPWNPNGVMVCTRRNGENSIIKMLPNGLHEWEWEDDEEGYCRANVLSECYDLGIAWHEVLPPTVQNGTAVVLLGSPEHPDTALTGDPAKQEEATPFFKTRYLRQRFYALPDDIRIEVEECPAKGDPIRTTIVGYRAELNGPGLIEHHEMVLAGGVKVHSYLRDAPLPGDDKGSISVRYQDELFEHKRNGNTYVAWGMKYASIRPRVYLVIEPPVMLEPDDCQDFAADMRDWAVKNGEDAQPGPGRIKLDTEARYEAAHGISRRAGIITRQDRGSLMWRTTRNVEGELPYKDWAQEWESRLNEIPQLSALIALEAEKANLERSLEDATYRAYLAQEFAPIFKGRKGTKIDGTAGPTPEGGDHADTEKKAKQDPDLKRTPRAPRQAKPPSARANDIPRVLNRSAAEFEDPWCLAMYFDSPDGGGEVWINRDHEQIALIVDNRMAKHKVSQRKRQIVLEKTLKVIGEQAAIKVCGIRAQEGRMPASELKKHLTPTSLTAACFVAPAELTRIDNELKGI